jgi:hypothetical protein
MGRAKWRILHVPLGSTRYLDAKGDPETISLSHDTPDSIQMNEVNY